VPALGHDHHLTFSRRGIPPRWDRGRLPARGAEVG